MVSPWFVTRARPRLAICARHNISPKPRRRWYHPLESEQLATTSPSTSHLLAAALNRVPAYGFTSHALRLGAEDVGYLPVSTNLFPNGPFAIVDHHLVTQRLALSGHFRRPEILPTKNEPPQDIAERIYAIMSHRLLANAPYASHYSTALALQSQPSNLATSVKELARLADEILYLAGSVTVTSAWYTDRAALASIYASAEMYMSQDKSRDFVETKGFLARRLNEAGRMRQAGSMVGKWVGMQLGGVVNGLRSKGVWI